METIELAEIQRIEEARTFYNRFVLKPHTVPGLRILLKSGEERIYPLDFPARDEILKLLRSGIASRT